MSVDLSIRRQGIGICLGQVTFGDGRRLEYGKVFTQVRADSPASPAFRLKLGFRVVGTAGRQTAVNGRDVDEIVARRFW